MNSAISSMLEKYQLVGADDYRNALKEIIQEVALLGLSRAGFFQNAAFYGGTALRVFYGLDRFSEDLDFSLLEPDAEYDLSGYIAAVRDELGAYGLNMTVEEKVKSTSTAIKSAFIKGGTNFQLLKINAIQPAVSGINADELVKIKFEVDTDPPAGADYEVKYGLIPTPYYVRLFTPSSLFAGKLHAILCRSWKSRVKGRDFYDYIWYLSRGTTVDIEHLRKRMIQSGHLDAAADFNEQILKRMLCEKFGEIDYRGARRDVLPFIRDGRALDLWSTEFFKVITLEKLVAK
ncbi:MAG: nucleotidyl transferase AbiEii/AbiGii toxin family protein [Negativicutes bacterium]